MRASTSAGDSGDESLLRGDDSDERAAEEEQEEDGEADTDDEDEEEEFEEEEKERVKETAVMVPSKRVGRERVTGQEKGRKRYRVERGVDGKEHRVVCGGRPSELEQEEKGNKKGEGAKGADRGAGATVSFAEAKARQRESSGSGSAGHLPLQGEVRNTHVPACPSPVQRIRPDEWIGLEPGLLRASVEEEEEEVEEEEEKKSRGPAAEDANPHLQ